MAVYKTACRVLSKAGLQSMKACEHVYSNSEGVFCSAPSIYKLSFSYGDYFFVVDFQGDSHHPTNAEVP